MFGPPADLPARTAESAVHYRSAAETLLNIRCRYSMPRFGLAAGGDSRSVFRYVMVAAASGQKGERVMRAIRFHGREDVRLDDIPQPSPKAGEIKLRVLYNGICGSDLHEYYHGPMMTLTRPHPLSGVQNPVVLGHEFSGEVVELGQGVSDLKVGDLIAVEPVQTCGSCHWCRAGQYNHCPTPAIHGYSRDGGGLAEYTVVLRSMAHKLPVGVS